VGDMLERRGQRVRGDTGVVDAGVGAWPMEVAREEEDESAGARRLLEEA
jgi:hypothetical protein